jgi:hypothetical protein
MPDLLEDLRRGFPPCMALQWPCETNPLTINLHFESLLAEKFLPAKDLMFQTLTEVIRRSLSRKEPKRWPDSPWGPWPHLEDDPRVDVASQEISLNKPCPALQVDLATPMDLPWCFH